MNRVILDNSSLLPRFDCQGIDHKSTMRVCQVVKTMWAFSRAQGCTSAGVIVRMAVSCFLRTTKNLGKKP